MSDYEIARAIADKLTAILHDAPYYAVIEKRSVRPMDVMAKIENKKELYFYYNKLCHREGGETNV